MKMKGVLEGWSSQSIQLARQFLDTVTRLTNPNSLQISDASVRTSAACLASLLKIYRRIPPLLF